MINNYDKLFVTVVLSIFDQVLVSNLRARSQIRRVEPMVVWLFIIFRQSYMVSSIPWLVKKPYRKMGGFTFRWLEGMSWNSFLGLAFDGDIREHMRVRISMGVPQ